MPKSEQEIALEGLLPKGIYDADIIEAEDSISKKGNPMLRLNVKVYNPSGGCILIYDYLMESVAHKLRHFAFSVGLGEGYENGVLDPVECIGKPCKVIVNIDDKDKAYPPKNVIRDYYVTESESGTAKKTLNPEHNGDDIPF